MQIWHKCGREAEEEGYKIDPRAREVVAWP
jgi:hypothetical protein